MTKVINLFGGPGAGKSTTAAGLFFNMKQKGIDVELVTEYAKDMTWENRQNILSDQLYILAKQHRKINRLIGKVEYIITDAPFVLGLLYRSEDYLKTFDPFVMDLWNQYENISYLLSRGTIKYHESGRNQTLDEAKVLDTNLQNVLVNNSIDYTVVDTLSAINVIMKQLNIE